MTTPDIAGLCERLEKMREWHDRSRDRETITLSKATLERQAAEIERLRNLLNGRDDFIVGEGLWPKFCDGLPPRAALTGEDHD
jgi:hypothetical protein